MDRIRKYTRINSQQHGLTFDLKRMEDIYEKMQGQPDDPHRHDYYTVVLVRQARGKHIIDFNEFDLSARQVYFISPGQVHQIIEAEKSYGWAFTFSTQFLLKNSIELSFIQDLHLFHDFGNTPPLELEADELAELEAIAERMHVFLQSNKKLKYQALGAWLKLFLIHCNNACTLNLEENTQTVQASVALLRNFKALLEERFAAWHKVSDYAKALHITADYLNASVKSLSGKSAKEHIQSRLLVAAKRYLLFSDLPTKEIAYKLGFSEPANFSQFFKRCTGISPSKFSAAQ